MSFRVAFLLTSFALLSSCVRADDPLAKPLEHLQTARDLFEQKAYAEAAKEALIAGETAGDYPGLIQSAAEIVYLSGFSKKSLPLFQRVVDLSPQTAPDNWQRGIALCSCGEWAEGEKQFKSHHDVNPNDVENSAWYFLCIAKVRGAEQARETVIPSRGDRREPMMSVLAMLKGEMKPEEVVQAAIENTLPGPSRRQAQFYADLYVGLYFDSLGNDAEATKYLKRSLTYGIDGYMADTARVYLTDRFPGSEKEKP